MPETGLEGLKLGLVLLWTVWLSLVILLNVTDGLKAMAILPESVKFASGNLAFIGAITKVYGTPQWLNAVLFGGVILWEGVAVYFFWKALFWKALALGGDLAAVNAAFTVSLALWGAFIIMDELFLSFFLETYDVAGAHRSIFMSFLLSLLAIHLL